MSLRHAERSAAHVSEGTELASCVLRAPHMITTTLLTLLAAAEVSTSSIPVEPPAPPTWSVQLSLAAPSLLGASFSLGPQTTSGLGGLTGGLGALGFSSIPQPSFSNGITIERALGEKWSGVLSGSFGYSTSSLTTLSGAGMLGARWYAKRTFDGFWAGPELLFMANTMDASSLGLSAFRTYAGGVRGRAGWTQPFGEHFLVSGSAGLGANLAWTTTPSSQQTLNLGLDLALSAGLVF